MTDTNYTAPIVNLNGTNGGDLLEQQKVVLDAAIALRRDLAAAAPHGRDYQVSPAGDYAKARNEWEADLVALAKIIERAEQLVQKLIEQPGVLEAFFAKEA